MTDTFEVAGYMANGLTYCYAHKPDEYDINLYSFDTFDVMMVCVNCGNTIVTNVTS